MNSSNSSPLVAAPTLQLPPATSAEGLLTWLGTVRVDGGEKELNGYLNSDFKRFLYTLHMVRGIGCNGKTGIEFGANPYFTSMLLKEFSHYSWVYSNYFDETHGNGLRSQRLSYRDFQTGCHATTELNYHHFNSEFDIFPFENECFDLVLYCEIIEHLVSDPCKVLRKLRNILSPEGSLVLSTPNVARLENIARLIDGDNIYDPYSGYGPYGRHNREYTCEELIRLLRYVGFEIDEIFTADVHPPVHHFRGEQSLLKNMLVGRADDLGQYIFLRAHKIPSEGQKLPSWLYRSFSEARLTADSSEKAASLSADFHPTQRLALRAAEINEVVFRVVNAGSSSWQFDRLMLGARAYDRCGTLLREFRGQVVGETHSGQSVNLSICVDLTDLPAGPFDVIFDLVCEQQFWFEDMGSSTYRGLVSTDKAI